MTFVFSGGEITSDGMNPILDVLQLSHLMLDECSLNLSRHPAEQNTLEEVYLNNPEDELNSLNKLLGSLRRISRLRVVRPLLENSDIQRMCVASPPLQYFDLSLRKLLYIFDMDPPPLVEEGLFHYLLINIFLTMSLFSVSPDVDDITIRHFINTFSNLTDLVMNVVDISRFNLPDANLNFTKVTLRYLELESLVTLPRMRKLKSLIFVSLERNLTNSEVGEISLSCEKLEEIHFLTYNSPTSSFSK